MRDAGGRPMTNLRRNKREKKNQQVNYMGQNECDLWNQGREISKEEEIIGF